MGNQPFFTSGWDRKDRDTDNGLRLIESWKRRVLKFENMFARRSAEMLLEHIIEKIPKGPEFDDYRESLRVTRVRGAKQPSWSVGVNRKARRIKEKDVSVTLLLVKPKRGGRSRSPEIDILARHNPWTPATLPLKPSGSDAVLVSRKVTKAEAQKVEQDRKDDQQVWKQDLAAIGVAVDPKAMEKLLKGAKTVPDAAFDAMRLEFGTMKQQGRAHWRPAIHAFRARGIRTLMRWRPFKDVFTKSRYSGWRQWPGRAPTISVTEAKTYNKFAKRVLKRGK